MKKMSKKVLTENVLFQNHVID